MLTKKMKKVVELPLSLIESEILPRLPAKSVGRCRAVCKQWKSFLSTPTFARMHLNHVTINDYKLLQSDESSSASTFDAGTIPESKPDPGAVVILASLDGLVCAENTDELVVFNPLTGAYKELPALKLAFGMYFGDVVSFYIDPSSNEYRLLYLIRGGRYGAYIYSLSLDSWRMIECSLDYPATCTWSSPTLCGQSLYFTLTDLDWESPNSGTISWIICFDVETETFRKIQFPFVPKGIGGTHNYGGGLVVLNGCLHLCISYEAMGENGDLWKHGDLWRMDGDAGWGKVAAFSDPLPLPLPPYDTPTPRQHICTASTGSWLAVLDQENSCFKKMKIEDFTTHYQYFSSLTCEYRSRQMIYVETLVSPNP